MNIDHKEVLKIILQFLHENNYNLSFETLLQESKLEFNFSQEPQKLRAEVIKGDWDTVLEKIRNYKFPKQEIFNLHEKIGMDLIDQGKMNAAKFIISKLEKQVDLTTDKENKILKLKQKHEFHKNSLNKLSEKITQEIIQLNRKSINEIIFAHTESLDPNLLITHLGHSLQFLEKSSQSGHLPKSPSLLSSRFICFKDEHDFSPNSAKIISLSTTDSFASCMEIDFSGRMLFIGYSDGIIEVIDTTSYRYSSLCIYQQEGFFMRHSKSISAMKSDKHSKSLVSLCIDSVLKVWDVEKGVIIKKIQVSFQSNMNCFMEYVRNETCIAVFSDKIKIFGLNSCKKVNEIETNFTKNIVKVQNIFKDDFFAVLENDAHHINLFDLKNCLLIKKIQCGNMIMDFDYKGYLFVLVDNSVEKMDNAFRSVIATKFDQESEQVQNILIGPNGEVVNTLNRNFECILSVQIDSGKKSKASNIEKEVLGMEMKIWKSNPLKNQIFILTENSKLVVMYNKMSFE